jgi:leucyl aminopeptidase
MSHHLHIFLCKSVDQLQGTSLKTIDGLRASLVQKRTKSDESTQTRFELTLCFNFDLSQSEKRWLFGQLLSSLKKSFSFKSYRLQRKRGISFDLYQALALDLKSQSDDVDVEDAKHDQIQSIASLEGGYRHWVNEDPLQRTSLTIAQDVLQYAQEHEGVEARVLEEDELQKEGLNLLLAVGGASQISPPRLVIATYGDPTTEVAPLMLVGKGITFDSGGINVKPYESFVSMMKNDMGGAALAWHLFKGLVENDFPCPVVVVLPTCENPIGEQAMRPGSVVTGHRGVSVRIDHTDAEGRLILADALSWATETYQPKEIISFATLTTAALIAYGPFSTPVHFAQPLLQKCLQNASDQHGEDLHFFPTRVWHREANRDHEAQLKNTGRLAGNAGRGAGSRNAGHFLRFFTDAHLTHLDIFASTWDWSGQAAGTRHGATGSPLRTLLTGLLQYGDQI